MIFLPARKHHCSYNKAQQPVAELSECGWSSAAPFGPTFFPVHGSSQPSLH